MFSRGYRRGYRRGPGMYGRRGGMNIGLFLLAAQLFQFGVQNIPPVTLGTICLNVAVFLKVFKVPSVSSVCLGFKQVYQNKEWSRLILAPFFHLDDMHLYFNMISLLWKGRSLERRLGSPYFFYTMAVFTVLVSVVLVAINALVAEVLGDPSYLNQCAAGFSGVLFAIKVVTTHYLEPGMQSVMGIPVPARLACWAELVIIQILVPRASFTGHLAGILVGLAYVHGPLKTIMDLVYNSGRSFSSQRSYTYMSGSANETRRETSNHNPSGYTTGSGMNEEEELQAAIRESLRTAGSERHHPPSHQGQHQSSPLYPTLPPEHSNPSPHYTGQSPTLPPSNSGYSTQSHIRTTPSAPPIDLDRPTTATNNLEQDELRRRRLAKLNR